MTKHKQQEEDTLQGEYIGFITTPIEHEQTERIISVLKQHNVTTFVCKGDDNWWTLVFPKGGTKTIRQRDKEERVTCYHVHLPDGFEFDYIPPLFYGKHNKSYVRLPKITVPNDDGMEE